MHRAPANRPDDKPSLSLILPAWNEAEVIADAINEADEALRQVVDRYEIVIVDDGSTDATADIVQAIASGNTAVRLVQHSANQGYGAALRTGFASAQHALVAFTDADCQFDLTELDRFVLLSGRYDIVCGYRIDRQDSALRCFYSQVYNRLVRALLGTGVRDVDCAMKLFHRDVAKRLKISGDGFLVNSELLVQANRQGRSVVEVGVSHRPRTQGESKVSVQHIPKVLASLARYWWNEMQFPATTGTRTLPTGAGSGPTHVLGSTKKMRLLQWSLLLIAAVFLLTNLGYPLIDRDETRYAEIPREMIATGNWILPQLNFKPYYDKPPLLYWLCAISFKLFGISEISARIVPALAALATIAATMFFGSRIFDRRIGLIAGVVLLLSAGFTFTGRYLLLDGVLSLFVSVSLFAAYEALRPASSPNTLADVASRVGNLRASSRRLIGVEPEVRLGWWLLSGVCIGLALLTKGPLAIALWLPPVFAMSWLSAAHSKPRWWHYGVVGIVAAAIALPWFIAVHHQDSMFLFEFFYKHNIARFAGEFHSKPFWYFVPVLLIAGHPWSFLTVPYARFLFSRNEAVRQQRTPAVGFLLLWSAWCFVFFSLSKCKLPTYLLPAAPALALMIGHYLNEVLRETANPGQHFFARFWSARTATATTCVAGVGLVIYVIITAGEVTASIYGWAMLWTSLLMSALLLMSDRHWARFAWGTSTGVAFLLAVMVMHQLVPTYSRSRTLFGQSSPLSNQLAVETRPPIATVDHEFSEVPFYLNRVDIPNFAGIDDAGLREFVLKSGQAILIVDERIDAQQVRARLPRRASMRELAGRGAARVYEVSTTPTTGRIATGSATSSKRSQR